MENPEEQEINRKRKNNDEEEKDRDFLTLSLACRPFKTSHSRSAEQPLMPPAALPPPPPPPPPPLPRELPSFLEPNQLCPIRSPVFPACIPWSMQTLFSQNIPQTPLQLSATHSMSVPPFLPEPQLSTTHVIFNYQEPIPSPRPSPVPVPAGSWPSPSPFAPSVRTRRNPSQGPREGKSKKIPTFFPWSTDLRARVQSLKDLREKQILTITGTVECKTCEKSYEMGFDLEDKFAEVSSFIARNKCSMHDRAPVMWLHPILPTCKNCGNSVKPVISEKKKSINWLFLLLGQILGCLTLEQLKYYCKHTETHRTGAKDRVLYLAYLGLCKQLDPSGPFDRY